MYDLPTAPTITHAMHTSTPTATNAVAATAALVSVSARPTAWVDVVGDVVLEFVVAVVLEERVVVYEPVLEVVLVALLDTLDVLVDVDNEVVPIVVVVVDVDDDGAEAVLVGVVVGVVVVVLCVSAGAVLEVSGGTASSQARS